MLNTRVLKIAAILLLSLVGSSALGHSFFEFEGTSALRIHRQRIADSRCVTSVAAAAREREIFERARLLDEGTQWDASSFTQAIRSYFVLPELRDGVSGTVALPEYLSVPSSFKAGLLGNPADLKAKAKQPVWVTWGKIWGISLTAEEFFAFASKIEEDLPDLQHLKITGIDGPEGWIKIFGTPLPSSVISLDLSDNPLVSPDEKDLTKVLSAESQFRKLLATDFGKSHWKKLTRFSIARSAIPASALHQLLRKLSPERLRWLDLSGNALSFSALGRSTYLWELGNRDLFHGLTRLWLRKQNPLPSGIEVLLAHVASNLELLDVSGSKKARSSFLEGLPPAARPSKLAVLIQEDVDLEAAHLLSASHRGFLRSLKFWSLKGNPKLGRGETFVENLSQLNNLTGLLGLDVSYCDLTSFSLASRGRSVPAYGSLVYLNAAENRLAEGEATALFSDRNFAGLRFADFSYNELGVDALAMISDFPGRWPDLEELWMNELEEPAADLSRVHEGIRGRGIRLMPEPLLEDEDEAF